ncbi:MAG: acyl carrier protein [Parasporobacterium sp.]|nr:acyl carrier protein [Parasporobacterium sp.]
MELEKLKEIIANVLNMNPENITPETRFIDDMGADSLDLFQVVLEIEDTFHIKIDDSQVEKISTVGDAAEAIKNAIKG